MADKRLEIEIVAQDRATRPIKNLQSTVIRFVGAVSASIAALGAITFPVNAARRFDRILRDVQKTTGFVNEDIKILSDQLLGLSKNVDTSADDLGRIAAAAGQLGLGEAGGRAIVDFTESIARAATTLDLTAEQAATSFAKIGTIFGIPIQQTEKLISTVNELSNTTTATANQLLDVITRVGTVAGDFEGVASLAAQAIQLGLSPETAGTSLVKIFSNFESRADEFAEAFGITVGDFLGKGAIERWQFYLTELSKLTDEEAAKLINRLSGSGRIFALVDKQVQDAANGFEIFNQAQANAIAAFDDGTSAIVEYENVAQSLDVQLGILRNRFAAIATQIGLNVVPAIIEASQRLGEFLQTDRAQAFFREIGATVEGIVNALIGFGEVLANIPTAAIGALFDVAGIFLLIKAVSLAIRIIEGFVVKILAGAVAVRRGAAGFQAFSESVAKNTPILRAFNAALADTARKTQETSAAVANSAAGINSAAAALNTYSNAIQTATVRNSGLQRSAIAAQRQLQRGQALPIQEAIPTTAAAGARVQALQKEIQLQEQAIAAATAKSKIEQASVKRAQTNIGVIKKIGTLNAVNAAKNRVVDREAIAANATIRRQAFRTIEIQRQATVAAQAKLAPLRAELATWREVLATRTQITLLDRVQAGTGIAAAGKNVGLLTTAVTKITPKLKAFSGIIGTVVGVFGLLKAAIGTIIRFLGGPLSAAILAATLLWEPLVKLWRFFTGEIEDESKRLTEVIQQQAQRQQAIINRQLADFARFQSKIQAGGSIQTETDFVTGEESFSQLENQVGRATRRLVEYADVIEATETQEKSLEDQQFAILAQLRDLEEATKAAAVAGEDVTENVEGIKALNATYRQLEDQIKQTNVQRAELELGVGALGRELASGTTVGLLDIARDLEQLAQVREGVGELEDQIKRLDSLKIGENIDPDIDAQTLGTVRAQLEAIVGDGLVPEDATLEQIQRIATGFRVQVGTEVTRVRGEAEKFALEIGKAVTNLTPDEQALLRQQNLTSLTARQLSNYVEAVEANEEQVRTETERRGILRDNAESILSQKFAYDRVNESLEDQQKQLEANRKVAEGIFDNTAKEVKAVVRDLQEFNRELDSILDRRDRELQLTNNIGTIGDNIESRTARIAELQKGLEGSTDAYANNLARAEISELQALNTVDRSVRRNAQREQAQADANRLIAEIPGLLAEAQDAVAAGDVVTATAIKNQLDQNLQDAQGLVTDLTGLTDDDGNFLFRENEIDSLQFALNQASGQFTNAIPQLNEDLRDATRAQEQQVADAIKELAQQNAKVIQEYEELLTAFPEFTKNLDVARQAWEDANQPLIQAIDEFGESVEQSLIAGRGLPEDFQQQLAGTQALSESTAEGIADRPQDFNRVVEALLAGADVQAWIDKVGPATEEGIQTGIEASVVDGIPTFSAAIRDATESGLTEALGAIELQSLALGTEAVQGAGNTEEDIARRQEAARRAAQEFAQQAEAIPVEAGLTAEASQQLIDDITKAVQEGIRQGFGGGATAEDAAGGFGASIAQAVADGTANIIDFFTAGLFSQNFRPQGPPGLATGGPVRGAGSGTSDSILARLSNGEYVSDARTVSTFGEGFFSMLKRVARGGGGTARSFTRGLPAFREGGPVFGGGGASTVVNLTLPGAGTFPVFAEADTVSRMTTAIRRENLKRGKRS